jgi:hypothetical protein
VTGTTTDDGGDVYEEYVAGVLSRRNATFSKLALVMVPAYFCRAVNLCSDNPFNVPCPLCTQGHRVVCVAKKGKKEWSTFGGSVCKEGQMHRDANGEPDAQEYYEQIPSTRVQ